MSPMTEDLASKWSAHAESLLQWSANVAEKAGNFAAEQTPLLVQEYLQWLFWQSAIKATVFGILWLVMIIIVALIWKYINRLEKEALEEYNKSYTEWKEGGSPSPFDKDNYLFARGMSTIIIGMLSVIPLFNSIDCGMDAAKVKIAPRVIIVEKIADLTKGKR